MNKNNKPPHKAPNNQAALPYLCEPQTLLGLVIMGELLALVILLAGSGASLSFSWISFGMTSLLIQWIILCCAATLCQIRERLNSLSPQRSGAISYIICLMISGLTLWLANQFFTLDHSISRWFKQFLMAAIVCGILLRYLWLQQQLRNREQAELNARFDVLQARIHPHFLFNSMNSIASLIHVDPDAAEKTVEDLSMLFRASLSLPSLIPLTQELDLCRRYIAIESIRLGERLTMDWDIDSPIPTTQIPSLLLQPLLENAIVHGIQKNTAGGTIRFNLALSKNVMTIYICNPLPEKTEDTRLVGGNKMAHQNIQHRLESQYGKQAKMRVDRNSANNSYEIILTLPINANSKEKP